MCRSPIDLVPLHAGRKFVIVVGCSAMMVFQLLFGLSPSFEVAVLCRVLLGLFNGLVGTAKTVASELCPHHRTDMQGKSMGIASAGVSIATLLGPSVSASACGYPLWLSPVAARSTRRPRMFASARHLASPPFVRARRSGAG